MTVKPITRRSRIAKLRPKLRKIEQALSEYSDYTVWLATDPRGETSGARAALLGPATHAENILIEVLDTGDRLLAALRNRTVADGEIARIERLFERDYVRFLGANMRAADELLAWRLRVRRFLRDSPMVNLRGEPIHIADIAPHEFDWMSESRLRFFAEAKRQLRELARLRRDYVNLINILAEHSSCDNTARRLATGTIGLLPTLKAVSRALFRILEILYDRDLTDKEARRFALRDLQLFAQLDRSSQMLGRRIGAWLARCPNVAAA